MLDTFVESESKATLEEFHWNYDAFGLDDLVEELLDLFLDSSRFESLEVVEMAGTIQNKRKRNEWREKYKEAEIRLILSDRQREDGEGTNSDESDGE